MPEPPTNDALAEMVKALTHRLDEIEERAKKDNDRKYRLMRDLIGFLALSLFSVIGTLLTIKLGGSGSE